MKFFRNTFIATAVAAALALTGCSSDSKPVLGETYVKAPSPHSASDVVVYFWYRCPACQKTEEAIHAYAKKHKISVEVRHSSKWPDDASLFYALHLYGATYETHHDVLRYFRLSRAPELRDILDIAEESIGRKIDTEDFKRRLSSPHVANLIQSAKGYERSVNSTGVPLVIVGNQYQLAPMSPGEVVKHIDELLKGKSEE